MTLLGQHVRSPIREKRGRSSLPSPPMNIRLIYPNATPLALNHERFFAALKIQQVWRGGYTRSILWSFRGILTQSRVLKIQRLWRGHRGRIIAAKIIYDKLVRAATRISLLYRCWKARRVLRIKRTEYLNKLVTRVQCLYRARAERKLFAAWLLARRIARATKIQSSFRCYLGRRRAHSVRQRLTNARNRISVFIRGENIASGTAPLLIGGGGGSSGSKKSNVTAMMLQDLSDWRIFEIGLLSIVGTKKFEYALDVAAYLIRRSPGFEMGFFLRVLALLASWTSVGLAKFIREDRLEEAVLICQQSSRWGPRNMFASPHGIPCFLQGTDKFSLFPDIFDEIELTFFKAAYNRTLEDVAPDVTIIHVMALRGILCGSWGRFGLTIDRTSVHLAESAKRRMATARTLGIMGESPQYISDQMDMKTEVIEQLFGKEHAVLYSEVKVFTDCPLYDPPASYTDPDSVLKDLKDPPPTRTTATTANSTSKKKSLLNSRPGSQQTVDGRDIYARAPPPIPCVKARVRVLRSGGGLLIVTADLLTPGLASAKTLKMVQNTGGVVPIRVPAKWQGLLHSDDDNDDDGDDDVDTRKKEGISEERAEEGSPRNNGTKAHTLAAPVPTDSLGKKSPLKNTVSASASTTNVATAESNNGKDGRDISRMTPCDVISSSSISGEEKVPHVAPHEHRIPVRPVVAKAEGVYSNFPVVRPIVLRSEEINSLLEIAIDHCSMTHRMTAIETRRRGKWMNVGQFLLDKIRLVSLSAISLPVPFFDATAEAAANERNNTLTVRNPRTRSPRHLLPSILAANHPPSRPMAMGSAAPFSPMATRPVTSMTALSSSADSSSSPVQWRLSSSPGTDLHRVPLVGETSVPATAMDDELPPTRQANWSVNCMAARMCLSQLELMRRERNDLRIEETSVRLLQRTFRGHKGRSLYRRLLFRSKEQARQQDRGKAAVEELLAARAYRFLAAAAVQKHMRGYLWRKQLTHMKFCALIVQCAFRIFKAKLDLAAERRRKLLGPDVITMFKGEVVVGERNFYLTVYRCGCNYRLMGQDTVRNQVYEGDVLKPTIEQILAEHNATILGTTVADKLAMIQLWQHQKVTKYIISRLGLAKRITSVTNDLGAKKTDTRLALVVLPMAKGKSKGAEERSNLHRLLRDQASVIERIEKREALKSASIAHEKKYEKYMSTGGSVTGGGTEPSSRISTATATATGGRGATRSGLGTATSATTTGGGIRSGTTSSSIFASSPGKSSSGSSLLKPMTSPLPQQGGGRGGAASLLSRNSMSFR